MAGLVHETRHGIPIANMFAESPVRLTGDEWKAVSTTALELPLNRANPHINSTNCGPGKSAASGQKSGLSARGTSVSLPS